ARTALPFLHQHLVVVGVGAEVGLVVLDDDELAIAAQTAAAVHHLARGAGGDRLAEFARNVDSLAIGRLRESADQSALGGRAPLQHLIFVVAGSAARCGGGSDVGLRFALCPGGG